jgi:capsular polysaccharide transport system permease protein
MNDRATEVSFIPDLTAALPVPPAQKCGILAALRRRWALSGVVVAIALAALYWGLIASDRYVSEARIVINRTDLASGATMDFATLLIGGGGAGGHDQLLLRDHLLSIDMLNKLDDKLKLRAHYSNTDRDLISRLGKAEFNQELFHKYFLSRIDVALDPIAGVLVINSQAYSIDMAHAITTMMVEEGERFMNEMAHRLAREQVEFLEKQLGSLSDRVSKARQAVVDYQNSKGLVSPQRTVESLGAIVGRLEGALSEQKARRQAMLGYLSKDAPDIAQINLQIDAIGQQIAEEQARLASPKAGALNRALEEFQRLQLEAEFAQDVYRTALVALEKGRVEATRTLKKVSVLQSPTLPQYPLEPRRLHNFVLFGLGTLLFAGIAHLIVTIVRDHKD